MKDHPGTMGGSTAMPTAKADGGSLSEKAMKDQPGTKYAGQGSHDASESAARIVCRGPRSWLIMRCAARSRAIVIRIGFG